MQAYCANYETHVDEPRAARSVEGTSCAIASAAEIGITPRCEATASISNGLTIVVCNPVTVSQNGRYIACSFHCSPTAPCTGPSTETPGTSIERAIALGKFALVCVTPSRVVSPEFVHLQANTRVHQVIIDESVIDSPRGWWSSKHHDLISKMATLFPRVELAVFRAVKQSKLATKQASNASQSSGLVVVSDVFRSSVWYGVEQRSCMPMAQLIEWLYFRRGRNGVIYGRDQVEVDEIAGWLQRLRFCVVRFHGGLSKHVRRAAAARFNGGGANLAVTPTGDGPWIDRVDLDFVLHTRMPSSTEAYLRDTRIADRGDSNPTCIIFYSQEDVRERSNRTGTSQGLSDELGSQLERMETYCLTTGCRHLAIIKHLKPGFVPPGESNFSCYLCDNCLSRPGACFGDQVAPV